MNKKIIWGILLSIIVVSLSACTGTAQQTVSTSSAPEARLNANGEGIVNLYPDIAYIQIGVHSEFPTVGEAMDDNTNKANAISSSLQELGVEEIDIQTSAFNVYPMEQYGPMGESMGTVYVVENTLLVTVRDLENMGRLLDTVITAGANNIYNIQFAVEDNSEAIAEARRLAVEDAKAKAEALAANSGVELGKIMYINSYSSTLNSVAAYDSKVYAGAGMDVPISAGRISVSASVNIEYEIIQ